MDSANNLRNLRQGDRVDYASIVKGTSSRRAIEKRVNLSMAVEAIINSPDDSVSIGEGAAQLSNFEPIFFNNKLQSSDILMEVVDETVNNIKPKVIEDCHSRISSKCDLPTVGECVNELCNIGPYVNTVRVGEGNNQLCNFKPLTETNLELNNIFDACTSMSDNELDLIKIEDIRSVNDLPEDLNIKKYINTDNEQIIHEVVQNETFNYLDNYNNINNIVLLPVDTKNILYLNNFVCVNYKNNIIELPVNHNNNLSLETLNAACPGATGLLYPGKRAMRGLYVVNGEMVPPQGGWEGYEFTTVICHEKTKENEIAPEDSDVNLEKDRLIFEASPSSIELFEDEPETSEQFSLHLNIKLNKQKISTCLICNKSIKNLSRHLKMVHKILDPLALITSKSNYRKNKSKRLLKCCIVCNKGVRRVPQHLREVHRISEDEIYRLSKKCPILKEDISLNKYIDIINSLNTKPINQLELSPDIVDQFSEEGVGSKLNKSIEDVEIVKQQFNTFLQSLSGGDLTNHLDIVRHVSDILKSVGNDFTKLDVKNVEANYFVPNLRKSQNSYSLNIDLNSKVKPSSLSTYLYSFKNFIRFLKIKYFTYFGDMFFKQWDETFPGWARVIGKEKDKHSAYKESIYEQTSLRMEYVAEYCNNEHIIDFEKDMLNLFKNNLDLPEKNIDVYVQFRNHLLVLTASFNANRPALLKNFKMDLYNNTKNCNVDGGITYLISDHKTVSSKGALGLYFDNQIKILLDCFIKCRALNCIQSEFVFSTVQGKRLSTATLNKILTDNYKTYARCPVNVSSNKLRKLASTSVAQFAPEEKSKVAKAMGHLTSTAETHYTFLNKLENAAQCSSTLKRIYMKNKTNSIILNNHSVDEDNLDNSDDEPLLKQYKQDKQIINRVEWTEQQINLLKTICSEILFYRQIPSLIDLRKIMLRNKLTKNLTDLRMVHLNKPNQRIKFFYAVLSKIKSILKILIKFYIN